MVSKKQKAKDKYAKNSYCRIHLLANSPSMCIEFHGPIAAIPILKNNKAAGRFPSPSCMARIELMDELYFALEPHNESLPDYGTEQVFCYVELSTACTRGVRFDPDNVLTTIKDWLEPNVIRKGKNPRGWGIGLVQDDKQVIGFVTMLQKSEGQVSRIYLHRYSDVMKYVNQFTKRLTF